MDRLDSAANFYKSLREIADSQQQESAPAHSWSRVSLRRIHKTNICATRGGGDTYGKDADRKIGGPQYLLASCFFLYTCWGTM
jgi:hypothetical protein